MRTDNITLNCFLVVFCVANMLNATPIEIELQNASNHTVYAHDIVLFNLKGLEDKDKFTVFVLKGEKKINIYPLYIIHSLKNESISGALWLTPNGQFILESTVGNQIVLQFLIERNSGARTIVTENIRIIKNDKALNDKLNNKFEEDFCTYFFRLSKESLPDYSLSFMSTTSLSVLKKNK